MTLRIPRWAAEQRLRRIAAVARIETLRLVRDRVAISLIGLVPADQIVLFGYAVNFVPKNVLIAIAGSDGFSVGRDATEPAAVRPARAAPETAYRRKRATTFSRLTARPSMSTGFIIRRDI
jgi:hypothetical protein